MVEIRIDNTGDGTWWLYNNHELWKDYCGCENFDEEVVLIGNRNLNGCSDAEWYQKAKTVLDDIDYYDDYPEDLSDETNAKLKRLYERCRCTDDILVDVIRLLYPDDRFETGTIRGYGQSDWQNYIVKGNINIYLLEEMYFGKISDVTVTKDDEEFGDIITHDELWEAERNGDLKEYFRSRYEIAEDEELHIFQADGYRKEVDWKEI